MRIYILCTVCLLTLFLTFSSTAFSEMRPALKKRAGTPPYEVLEEIINAGNTKSSGIYLNNKPIEKTQTTPHLVWVVEPDPDFQPTTVYKEPGNKVLIIRSNESKLKTIQKELDYAVLELLSPVLLFTSSTKTADTQNSGQGIIKIEENIDMQVELAMKRYSQRVESGRLTVIGSIYDVKNLYGRGASRQIVINVNGEKNGDIIKSMPLTARITPDDLASNFGRN